MPDPKANVMALPRHYLESIKKLLKDPEFLSWPLGKLRGFGLFVADLDSKGALCFVVFVTDHIQARGSSRLFDIRTFLEPDGKNSFLLTFDADGHRRDPKRCYIPGGSQSHATSYQPTVLLQRNGKYAKCDYTAYESSNVSTVIMAFAGAREVF